MFVCKTGFVVTCLWHGVPISEQPRWQVRLGKMDIRGLSTLDGLDTTTNLENNRPLISSHHSLSTFLLPPTVMSCFLMTACDVSSISSTRRITHTMHAHRSYGRSPDLFLLAVSFFPCAGVFVTCSPRKVSFIHSRRHSLRDCDFT